MEYVTYYIPDKIVIWIDNELSNNCSTMCNFMSRKNAAWICRKFHVKLGGAGFKHPTPCDECLAQIELHKPYQKLLEQ